MYGTPPAPYPQRIVCLTAETTEVAFALGAGDRVVGVSGAATRPPEAREKPKVGGFTTFRLAPGPSLLRGLRTVHDIIQAWVAGQPFKSDVSNSDINS